MATFALQMLMIVGQPQYETAINQAVGASLPVEWVTITDPDPPTPAGASGLSTVFLEGLAAGGARFRRREGCWHANGRIFFVSTNGGNMGLGQTWVYDPSASTLTMIFKSPSYEVCDGPDNCCVTPRGGLILCEDAGGRAVPASALTIGTDIRSGAKPAQHHRVCGCVLQSRRPHAVRDQYGRATVRTTQPYRSALQIPVGPERFERAATLAIWGPWKSGPL